MQKVGQQMQTDRSARAKRPLGALECKPTAMPAFGDFAQRRNKLDPGDIDRGLAPAAAWGTIKSRRPVFARLLYPRKLAHGFAGSDGLESGDMRSGNTSARVARIAIARNAFRNAGNRYVLATQAQNGDSLLLRRVHRTGRTGR